jgi:CheY-like chemotaxis protein
MNDDQQGQWQASIGNDAGLAESKIAVPDALAAGKTTPNASSWQNKIVLLIDINPHTRDSRAKMMRTLGVTVDCVDSAEAAHSRLATGKYNMVLVDLGRDLDGAELLAQDIRSRNPRQLVAFLVGSPLFVATSLKRDGMSRQRPRVAVVAGAVQKPNAPAVASMDFGQKIRAAEAEQAAS